MKKTFSLFIITLALAAAVIALFLIHQRYPVIIENFPKFAEHSIIKTPSPTSSPTSTIPNSIHLTVPFTAQAPTGNWDTIHNEDCEEASAIMVAEYFLDSKNSQLDPELVEGQLTKLTDWELQNFGYNLDINSSEVVQMIQANSGLMVKLQTDFTINDIKKELSQNHLVLIPENGQLLGNPNYKQPGPKYHMLVIRGYTGDTIITNDPGTRNGQNYSYDFKTLYQANGNWDHSTDKVNLSDKNIIIVWK